MSIDKDLETAVRTNNLEDIRGFLWSCIMLDSSLTGKFRDSLRYVLSKGISEDRLYEKDNGVSVDDAITDANFDRIVGELRVNFSKKKIEALQRIGGQLYACKNSSKTSHDPCKNRDPEVSPQRGRRQAGRKKLGKKTAVILVVLGVAIAFAIGGCVVCKILNHSAQESQHQT